ncbi:hypothetical protein G9A89_003354 [Geosiphon pyriformis]|nr:hypothetical protein G9A89_003354 [Geosiphon pyriformis]
MVALKTEYSIKDVDLSGNFGILIGVSNKVFVISSDILNFVAIKSVGFSAGSFGTGLTGLGSQSGTKKKIQVESVYT